MDEVPSTAMLVTVASVVGLVHTAAVPGHYLPFVAVGKSRGWSLPKTLMAVFVCGIAHVLSSFILGLAGIMVGLGVGVVERFQYDSGSVAKCLFFIFASAYLACGLYKALTRRPSHRINRWITSDGSLIGGKDRSILREPTFLALFAIFILGPCEMLAPLLVYPSSHLDWISTMAIAAVFSGATITAMLALVCLMWIGAGFINLRKPEISLWGDAATGVVLLFCALFMFFVD